MLRVTNRIIVTSLGAMAMLWLSGCFEATDDNYTLPHRKYVAMGNSLTAGFQSSGLSEEFQVSSYPALLAQAMGDLDFQQPLIEKPGIASSRDSAGNPRGVLTLDVINKTLVYGKVTKDPKAMLLNSTLPRPYGNLGVPGAMTVDVLNASTATTAYSYIAIKEPNPYFDMVLRGGTLMNGTSMLAQTIAQQPEIITLEIGNNDVLGGVTNGTVILGATVTQPAVFQGLITKIVDSLLSSTHAKIFLGNIPNVTTIPYVTAIPSVMVDAAFKEVMDTAGKPMPWYSEEDSVQQVLFPALALIMGKEGYGIPGLKKIPAKYTLTTKEAKDADVAVNGYNAALDALAKAHSDRVVLVDVNGLLKQLKETGVNGLGSKHPLIQILTEGKNTSAFSYDGIHPNTKGYKEVAKLFLAAINKSLNTTYTLPN